MGSGVGVGYVSWDGYAWLLDDDARDLLGGVDPGELPLVSRFLEGAGQVLTTWAFLDDGLCEVRLRRDGSRVFGFLLAHTDVPPGVAFLLHELATPLATARAVLELDQGSDPAALAALDRVRALMVVARASGTPGISVDGSTWRGKQEADRVCLLEVARSAVAMVWPAFAGQLPDVAGGPEVPAVQGERLYVRAPRLLLEQVVVNLLTNAFRHGCPPVGVVVRASEGRVLLEVSDDGPGFEWDAALLPGARSAASVGMGAGLALVLAMAARCGAHLAYRRDPSTVTLSLPAA